MLRLRFTADDLMTPCDILDHDFGVMVGKELDVVLMRSNWHVQEDPWSAQLET